MVFINLFCWKKIVGAQSSRLISCIKWQTKSTWTHLKWPFLMFWFQDQPLPHSFLVLLLNAAPPNPILIVPILNGSFLALLFALQALLLSHLIHFLARQALGGFQLLDLIITELKSHMTCYSSMPLIGWNYSIQTWEKIL